MFSQLRTTGGAKQRRFRMMRSFATSTEGAVALIFALLLIPLLLAAAGAVDYVRAQKAKEELKTAADAASLAAAQKLSKPISEIEAAAVQTLQANLASSPLETVEVTVTKNSVAGDTGVEVTAQGQLSTFFMRVIGRSSVDIGATSRAVAQDSAPIEIALVLDNTGSMVNDMAAMKAAAKDFAERAFSASSLVKMSVVPYVAAVNVGASMNPAMLDVDAKSAYHASTMIGRWIGGMPNCNAWADQPPVDPGTGGGGPSTPFDPGTPIGNDKTGALEAPAQPFSPVAGARKLALELFGISKAAAGIAPGVTANTLEPIVYSNSAYTPGAPFVTDGSTAMVPMGFAVTTKCWLAQPGPISHFDLFNRIPGAAWKGCVEARPDPYDVNDDPPNAALPNTLFVPYFARDEAATTSTAKFANDYMSDSHKGWEARGGMPPGWFLSAPDGAVFNILKYDGLNTATIQESGPNSKGPNANCPDEMLKLTSNKTAVLNRIDTLSHWNGGGTMNSEGLMWGWRSISPNAPFAMGRPYDDKGKKYIVLMSDGLNSLVANRPDGSMMLLSEYTPYGYLIEGRLGSSGTFSGAENILNERFLLACANAKAKGVGIFTILFRETDATTKSLMQQCASSPSQSVFAADSAALGEAFKNISGQLSRVRLTK